MMNVIDINTSKGKEHYLIICFSYYLGLRISDIVNLKLSNINFHDNLITLVQDKTSEILSLPLIDQVKYPLLDYLKNVRPRDCELDYIFVTQKKLMNIKLN